jgi:hypothetical protein
VLAHGRLGAALTVAQVFGQQPTVAAIGFTPAQIRGIDFATGTAKQTGFVAAADVLAALSDLGSPGPVIEEQGQQLHPPPTGHGSNLLRGRSDVEQEIAERQLAHASPGD